MKRFLGLSVALLLTFCSGAHAANERIGLSMEAAPVAGPLFREVPRPVAASLTVTVSNPPAETTIEPLKVANVTFPRDMDFFPNPRVTPPCPESRLNEGSNLAAGVAAIVRLCPRSVVGTGTATVQLARGKSAAATLRDPQLVVFSAGRTAAGRPKVTIYGYSRTVNSGLLMRGTLARDGQLKINIGVLPFDSSVSEFTLGIPGGPLEVEDPDTVDGTSTVKGLDPAYLRARCATGRWLAKGSFVLGQRAHPSGVPTGPGSYLVSDPFELGCSGRAGSPRIGAKVISGPRRLKAGRRGLFVVKISNTGSATAKALRIRAHGAASALVMNLGSLKPGASRRTRLKVRARPRPGGGGKVRILVTASGSKTKRVIRKLKVG